MHLKFSILSAPALGLSLAYSAAVNVLCCGVLALDVLLVVFLVTVFEVFFLLLVGLELLAVLVLVEVLLVVRVL